MKRSIAYFILAVLLASCQSSDTKNTDKSIAPPTEKPSINGAEATQIKVTLTGGSNAGIYTATSVEPTCSMGLTGEKSFGNQYSAKGKSDTELSSLQLMVDDYEAAKAGTGKFYIKVAFGKILQGKSYEINGSDNSLTGKKGGSGKLTITENGGNKIATVEGTTADGVSISATISCASVVTSDGIK